MAALAILTTLLLIGTQANAQTSSPSRTGTIVILVHDLTDLPILGAEVTITNINNSTLKAVTNDRGEARFEGIQPGVYSGRITASGFNPTDVAALSIRAGDRAQRQVTLQIEGFFEEVGVAPVSEDRQLLDAFTRQLTPEELAALPEDPEELALVLALLAGEDADIRVDGFRGGRLPLGTAIQEIRVLHDVGASSSGGGPRVEIRTTPGGGRWRNNAGMTVRDAALNSRNSFSRQRPTGQARQYSWSLNGPLIRNQTGLSLSVESSEALEHQTIRAAAPGGLFSSLVEQPSNGLGFSARLDHRITPAHSIRIDVQRNVNEADNQGIGEFDLPERAFTDRTHNSALRIGHHATLNRRYVNDLRFAVGWDSTAVSPFSNVRTIRVLDAFTSGGAQQQGGVRSRKLEMEEELEFVVRERHRVTAGASIDRSDYDGDEYSNASGTYTFSSLAAFEAGRPTTFTQRVGDPTFRYSLYRFGWYVQDDFRVTRNILVNTGLRHDFQTHMRDWANFSPRLGVSWTPSRMPRTTLRASAGIVYLPLDARTYQQLLLVNGVAQHDVVISNPGYPDPFSAGVYEAAPPASVIRAASNLVLPSNRRLTFGVDQRVGKFFRLRTTFLQQTGENLFRSRNINAPIEGVRPDPSLLNVSELETTAHALTRSFQNEVVINYPPKRLSANVNYVFGKAMNETDGAFSLPPDSSDLTGEWGPSRGDARHNLNVGWNSDLIAGFRVAATFRTQSALPYNITTGTDPNGDGVPNERPAGVTRNSGRGTLTKNLDLTLTWRLGLGQRGHADEGVDRTDRRPPAGRGDDPFRLELFARATNVLNLVNPVNFSGVLTSPFFGSPTSAAAARRVVVGTRVWF